MADTLRESEARYRLLLESTPEAIYAIDLEGYCTWCNPSCVRLLGYRNRDAIVGQNAHSLFHHTRADGTPYPRTECRIYRAYQQAEGAHVTDEVFWRADQTSVPVEYWSDPIWSAGRVIGAVVTFADIAERKDAEVALGDSERRFRATFEHAGIGMAIVAANGHPVEVNVALRAMLGYTTEELAAMSFEEFTHPDDRETDLVLFRELIAGTRNRYEIEKRYIRKDQQEISARLTVSLVRDATGQPQYAVGMVEDITRQRQLEDQLRQTQKMEAVGRLAGGVAHDFNNLITVILAECELALLAGAAPEVRPDAALEEIRKAAKRAAILTRQLLSFSRRQLVEPASIPLNEIVVEVDQMLRRLIGEDLELTLRLAPDLGYATADRGQLEQVIVNLVVNARDAMPTGGTLTVETANGHLGPDYVAQTPGIAEGDYVVLAVSDTGVGMTEDVKAHLFEPFFTTKEPGKGTGLGLATCYAIVRQFNGHIAAYSEIGVGTTMRVYLPRTNAPPSVDTPAHGSPSASLHGEQTILLVEDESQVRHVTTRMLEALGYAVLQAANGEEALALVAQRTGPVHLLLTDVVLPKMGGRILAERLREIRPGIRVLFTSGYSDDVIIQHQLLERGILLLQKPFTRESLARKVREALTPAKA